MVKPQVALVRCSNYEANLVEDAVRRAVDHLGGIGRFVKSGERVLIKPNLLTDALPEAGITTHPEMVRAVIRLVKSRTPHILVGDSPSVWGERVDIERVFETTGVARVCREEKADMVSFSKARMFGSYPLTEYLDICQRVVSVPKFKTHGLTVLTAGLKNLYGLIVGGHKMLLHEKHPKPEQLCRVIVDLYEIRRPDLTILDGIVAMEGQGPGSGGTLRALNLVAAADEALALDTVLADIMGVRPDRIPTNRQAYSRQLGSADLSSIIIKGEDVSGFKAADFLLPRSELLETAPDWVVMLLGWLLKSRPVIKSGACRRCGVCQKGCPVGAITIGKETARIDPAQCVHCLCCLEVCPYAAVVIQQNLCFQGIHQMMKWVRASRRKA